MRALETSGEADNTVVMFMSDHGMPLPLPRRSCTITARAHRGWCAGPASPAGSVDKQHMISVVDFLPTVLDITGIKHPKAPRRPLYLPLLKGDTQSGREHVIKYNENSGRSRDPMRAIQTKRFLYLFNPWSNGERVFAATTGTTTFRRLAALAETNNKLAARLDLYKHRVPEELYDVVKDPDCLHNLIDSPKHLAELKQLRATLDAELVKSRTPCSRPSANAKTASSLSLRAATGKGSRRTQTQQAARNKPNKNKPKKRTP